MEGGSLEQYFQLEYLQGKDYTGCKYQHAHLDGERVFEHVGTRIRVWAHALDVRKRSVGRPRVLFHYTTEHAFHLITAFWNKEYKLWASKNAKVDSNFGLGLYATSGEPASWRSKALLYLNNYWPKREDQPKSLQAGLTIEEYEHSEVCESIMDKFRGKADYCIPIICDEERAYDIQQRCTPEMQAAGALPGQNRWCEDEPSWRNVWVVNLGKGEDLIEAPTRLLAVMELRVEHYRQNCGLPHDRAAESFRELAHLHGFQGAHDKAESLFREVLRVQRGTLGEDHPFTTMTSFLLVQVLDAQGRTGDAASLCRQTLEHSRQLLGNSHTHTLLRVAFLGKLLLRSRHLREAAPLIQEAYDGHRHAHGANHVVTLDSMANMVELHIANRHWQEAEDLCWELLKLSSECLGDLHLLTQSRRCMLALVLCFRGRLPEAKALLREALGRCENLGNNHPSTEVLRSGLKELEQLEGTGATFRVLRVRLRAP